MPPESMSYQMWIDDTTGKAVQFLVSSPTPRDTDAAHALVANWNIFFQGYYGIEIVSVKEKEPKQGETNSPILCSVCVYACAHVCRETASSLLLGS